VPNRHLLVVTNSRLNVPQLGVMMCTVKHRNTCSTSANQSLMLCQCLTGRRLLTVAHQRRSTFAQATYNCA